jgi:hypothetical protein
VALGGKPAMAEPVETLRLCASCLAALQQDEVPFEEEVGAGLQVPES